MGLFGSHRPFLYFRRWLFGSVQFFSSVINFSTMANTHPDDLTHHYQSTNKNLRLAMQLTIALVIITTIYECARYLKTPYNNSKLGGAEYTDFLISGNPHRCRSMLRMDASTFELLALKLSHLDHDPVCKRYPYTSSLQSLCSLLGRGPQTGRLKIDSSTVAKRSLEFSTISCPSSST